MLDASNVYRLEWATAPEWSTAADIRVAVSGMLGVCSLAGAAHRKPRAGPLHLLAWGFLRLAGNAVDVASNSGNGDQCPSPYP